MTSTVTLDPMIHHEYLSTKSARAQVVYLANVKRLCVEEIAAITHYAISTIKVYARKFLDLLEYAKSIFRKGKKRISGNPEPRPCAYVIELFDNKGFKWLKIGKAINLKKRCNEHLTYYKKDGITSTKVKQAFYTDNEDDALIMESALRKHYKANKEGGFIPKDRFEKIRYDEKELAQDEAIGAQYQFLGYATA